MIVVTGATGKLGRHVIDTLLKSVAAKEIVAAVRDTAKASPLASLGVQVREADYSKPQTLDSAFAGADKVLLISSNEVGQRVEQHKAVIDACVKAKVKLLVYTSLLRADTSTLALAIDHLATERLIEVSGLASVMLRNGWYLENHTEALGPALQYGAIPGAAKDGRFAAASRKDYAAAAAAVLTGEGHEGKVYELAGDESYTLTELAAAVSSLAGKPVAYRNLSVDEYEATLVGFGLPPAVASILADSDAGAARGELDSTSRELHTLIGRATISLAETIKAAIGTM